MNTKMFVSVLVAAAIAAVACHAETYFPEQSNRVKINLGRRPGSSSKGDPPNAQDVSFP